MPDRRPGPRLASVMVLAVAVSLLLVTPAAASHEVTTDRMSGENRFATAAAVAAATYPDGTGFAFLARGDEFADALAAAPFSRQAGAPILLTRRDAVPSETAQALGDLGVDEVVLLGGTEAISAAVETELEQDYTVARVSGETRYETAAAIARAIALAQDSTIGTLDGLTTVFVASGTSYPDALAAGAPAAAQDDPLPILLTPRDGLHPAAADAIQETDVEQAVVVGGTAVVGDPVVADLEHLGLQVRRLAGPNRLATAAAVADFTVGHLDVDGEDVVLARGDAFPDALTAGPYAGRAGATIVLAGAPDRLGVETLRWFDSACLLVRHVEAVGGTAAVADGVLAQAAETAEGCHGSWGHIPDGPIASRLNHTATWTGTGMAIWGGEGSDDFSIRNDGVIWYPDRRRWDMLEPAPIDARWLHDAVLTDDELIVWGGTEGPDHLAACYADGAAYDLDAGTWRTLPGAPGGGRCGGAAVWTGAELVVFGGTHDAEPAAEPLDDAVAYDPLTDTWEQIPSAPVAARTGAVAVWSGEEVLVFGGTDADFDPLDDGAAYNPASGAWREIDPSPLPARPGLNGARVGEGPVAELLVFGGDGRTDAAVYDPVTDAWRQVEDMPGPQADPATAWTGEVLYVVGGPGVGDGDGPAFVAYVAAEDAWAAQPDPPGGARSNHTAVWTGAELLVWGGQHDDGPASGVTWRPPS